MDVEAIHPLQQPDSSSMSRRLKPFLLVINIVLLALGATGGPMLSRLYFFRGGHREWLSSFLETAGFPLMAIPLYISYQHRRHHRGPVLITSPVFAACAFLGLLTGLDDYFYAYGLSFLPVSTSAILTSTHLAFTAFFAWVIVRQRFTAFSLNAVALLTVGAAILGLHSSTDRPIGVSKAGYFKGFALTLGSAALYGLILPLVALVYAKAKMAITYSLVMEMQLVMGFFGTIFCVVGMIAAKDFQAIPNEAKNFELGEVRYYIILVWQAIFWQCFFLGAIGVIFSANTLLAGVIIAVCIPVNEVLGVIFYHEKFSGEKGFSLALSLWGLASYSYGEYKAGKAKEAKANEANVKEEGKAKEAKANEANVKEASDRTNQTN